MRRGNSGFFGAQREGFVLDKPNICCILALVVKTHPRGTRPELERSHFVIYLFTIGPSSGPRCYWALAAGGVFQHRDQYRPIGLAARGGSPNARAPGPPTPRPDQPIRPGQHRPDLDHPHDHRHQCPGQSPADHRALSGRCPHDQACPPKAWARQNTQC